MAGIDIRLPPRMSGSDRETLKQMNDYLFQLASQLQWALKNVDTSNNTVIVTPLPQSRIAPAESQIDAQATFGAIKSLIIKSAEIVEAYSEEIKKKLSGEYVAVSDYGTFKKNTEQEIQANSTMLGQTYSNIQEIASEVVSVGADLKGAKTDIDASIKGIEGDVGQLDDNLRNMKTEVDGSIETIKGQLDAINYTLIEVTANTNSGLLYYNENGIPVYGFEVGQRTKINGVEVFNKYARFTADRLSFYDQNDNEVAYISDRKLYITHVEIKGTFVMGGFVRTVLADRSIVKRWVTSGGER